MTTTPDGIVKATRSTETLTLPEPPSSNRWWRTVVIKGQARVLLSREAREYKKHVALIATGTPHDGPVAITIDWYRGRAAGDLDKRLGVAIDALQGVLYANDSQIVELAARRHDAPGNPHIVVTVRPIGAVQESFLPGEPAE